MNKINLKPCSTAPTSAITLIELITVIAVIALLTAIIVPTVSNTHKAALKSKTKAQFKQYVLALDAYCQEYGEYPSFLTQKGEQKINIKSLTHAFVKALSGVTPAYDQLSTANLDPALNPKAIPFYDFSENEFFHNQLVDPFYNPNIYVIVDTNGNGVIESVDIPGSKKRVESAAIIFTESRDGDNYQDIRSW